VSRILIVEDDPAILVGLKDNLAFESHQVLTATDGEAGYRTLREHSPDLVILDLMLPKLSGYGLRFAHPRPPSACRPVPRSARRASVSDS
jgi:DNA-binding response OmpR family regulator